MVTFLYDLVRQSCTIRCIYISNAMHIEYTRIARCDTMMRHYDVTSLVYAGSYTSNDAIDTIYSAIENVRLYVDY